MSDDEQARLSLLGQIERLQQERAAIDDVLHEVSRQIDLVLMNAYMVKVRVDGLLRPPARTGGV